MNGTIVIRFDSVTHALMVAGGIDPATWLSGLEPEVSTYKAGNVLLGLSPGSARSMQAKSAIYTDPDRFDLLEVIDDNDAWRVVSQMHMPVSPGIWWETAKCRNTEGAAKPRYGAGLVFVDGISMPETVTSALVGRTLDALVELPGFETATVTSAEILNEVGEFEVRTTDVDVKMIRPPHWGCPDAE